MMVAVVVMRVTTDTLINANMTLGIRLAFFFL